MLKAAFISWMTDRSRKVTDRSRRVNVRGTFKGGDREVGGLAVRGIQGRKPRSGWAGSGPVFTVVPLNGINVRGALRRYLAAEPPIRLATDLFHSKCIFIPS